MSDQKPNLDSLFEAAVEIESAEERAAFLEKSCGNDTQLRQQLQRLLESNKNVGSFLEKSPAELKSTIARDPSSDDLAASRQAGLSPTFGEDQAAVDGRAGHSVLQMLGQTIDVPHVSLRESAVEGADSIQRPNSPEIPYREAESRYQLQGEIARGGMGVIIKGHDVDLGRDLAIKVLLNEHKTKPEVIQRFVEEAQIGGQLQHPGIAPVYELGQLADQRPFFSMKLVKGKTLSALLAEREDADEDRGRFIGIFEQICQTMAYAHSRGVIHRDLKPANVMVGAFGEVQVMDWGLAKVLPAADENKARDKQQGRSSIQTLRSGGESRTPLGFGSTGSPTQMGSVMGTPAYMPPEQALGKVDNMDERADLFGLGAILCEILTGQPPYIHSDGTQVYWMASRGKLEDCFKRLDACKADVDLVALAKQCLELEPSDRPRDAGELAKRVTGYLESVQTKLRETELARAAQAARATEERKTLAVLAESTYNEASMAILAGDDRKATLALTILSEMRYSQDKIDILHSLIEHNNGHHEKATRLAERVRDSATDAGDRLAAQAVLVSATAYAFDWNRGEIEQDKLNKYGPKSETEKLLVANALAVAEPRDAIRLLEETPSIQRSPVGLFIRGQARYYIGCDTQDRRLLEDAARDFECAGLLFSENTAPISWQLATLANAANIARRDGESEEDVVRFLARGRPLAKGLERTRNPVGDWASWVFWRAVHEDDKVRSAFDRLLENGGSLHMLNAAACLRDRNAENAIQQFERRVSDADTCKMWVQIARAHVVRNLPEGKAKVRAMVADYVTNKSPMISDLALGALCHVSSPEEIQRLARQAVSASLDIKDVWDQRSCIQYFSDLDEEALLERAGDRRLRRVSAMYALAMIRVAEGDLNNAYEYFKRCVHTNIVGCFQYELARAYIHRIESDSSWPPWLDGEARAD